MASTTFSANAVARDASKVMGRTVTAKQVRGLARDSIARFDKTSHPAYQSHEYTAAERSRLLAVFTARRGKAPTRSKAKTATVARKTARKVKATSQIETPDSSGA